MPPPEFSRNYVRWFNALPKHKQDQIRGSFEAQIPIIKRICEWMRGYIDDGIEMAEDHANGEDA